VKKFLTYFISSILLISLVVIVIFFLYKSIKKSNSSVIKTEVDYKTLVPKESILFETLTKVSPDKKYTAFITAKNLGLVNSEIWVANKYGDLTKIDYQTGEFSSFGAIVWNSDGTKFAYLKLFPTQIVVVDTINNFYREKIITKENNEDNGMLNPSIGYEGKSYLKWNDKNQIEFEDNNAIPTKKYAFDYTTKKVLDLASNYSDSIAFNNSNNDSFFSQRDKAWRDKQLGNCKDSSIGSGGCAIASIAMAFKNFGVSSIDPDKLNSMLKMDGYVNDCDVKWYIAPSFSPTENIVFKGAYGSNNGFQRMDYELSLGNEVILGFDKVPYTNIPHWVVVRKKENEKYFVSDPWSFKQDENRTLDSLGGKFDHMIVYTKQSSID